MITCTMLGTPSLKVDGRDVFLPYAKVGALLYYLFATQTCSRDEIAGLLWPDEGIDSARRNLRNAIYQAKKLVGMDIITSPNKGTLVLNRGAELDLDIDRFQEDPKENLDLYRGEFLQNFYLKDTDLFEYWTQKMRNYYKKLFSDSCRVKIEENLRDHEYDRVEARIQSLIALDPFDENNFRLLLRYYQDRGRPGRVVEAYYQFARSLRKELDVDPEEPTRELYEAALERMNSSSPENRKNEKQYFYGRMKESAALDAGIKRFREKSGDTLHMVLSGEAGSGKTILLERAVRGLEDKMAVFRLNALQAERELPCRPFVRLLHELDQAAKKEGARTETELNREKNSLVSALTGILTSKEAGEDRYKMAAALFLDMLLQMFSENAGSRQILLLCDDMQFLDEESLEILGGILLEMPAENFLFLGTMRPENEGALFNLTESLVKADKLKVIELSRFTADECLGIMTELLGKDTPPNADLEYVYSGSAGNPFLVNEYISIVRDGKSRDVLTPAITEFIRRQFLYLREQEMETARIISLFEYDVEGRILEKAADKTRDEVLLAAGELVKRGILQERRQDGDIVLSFAHPRMAEYLRNTIPISHRLLLHKKIGLIYEEEQKLSGNRDKMLHRLIYHFTEAQDRKRALRYQLLNLKSMLNFAHEMFPVSEVYAQPDGSGSYFSGERVESMFARLDKEFEPFDGEGSAEAELEFTFMKGRYFILKGDYDQGVSCINFVIRQARLLSYTEYVLEGYKQMIIYHLQINDAEGMKQNLAPAMDFVLQNNNYREIGILLRLKGVSEMLSGNMEEAERLFEETIRMFSVTQETTRQYVLNIAAAYNYIGEIRLSEGKYREAFLVFEKALAMCPPRSFYTLAVLDINAGKACYYMERYGEALEYFLKSFHLYAQSNASWRRPVLSAYMALSYLRTGEYGEARKQLETARYYMYSMKNPSDIGTVFFAESLIRSECGREESLARQFERTLTETPEYYATQARRYLHKYVDADELRVLKNAEMP